MRTVLLLIKLIRQFIVLILRQSHHEFWLLPRNVFMLANFLKGLCQSRISVTNCVDQILNQGNPFSLLSLIFILPWFGNKTFGRVFFFF